MKGITLHQPWASAIAFKLKEYETRPRKTNYRGLIAIHAGKTKADDKVFESLSTIPWNEHLVRPMSRKWLSVNGDDFPTGAIVAVAEISDCIAMDDDTIAAQSAQERVLGHWETGRHAYKLENIQALPKPIPVSGKQGLWNVDDETLALIKEQIELPEVTDDEE